MVDNLQGRRKTRETFPRFYIGVDGGFAIAGEREKGKTGCLVDRRRVEDFLYREARLMDAHCL